MSEISWTNYFVYSTHAFAKDGHLPADDLRTAIIRHTGEEAYHCAFDLDKREDFTGYVGPMRPALGFVWFDFDSHDGGVSAHTDTQRFTDALTIPEVFVCYSGSKGFHVGVPFDAFGLLPDHELGRNLNAIARHLKASFPTIDTTVFNANRKFRALGSIHPRTGLYKTHISLEELKGSLDAIKKRAVSRGDLQIPHAPTLGLCDLLRAPPQDRKSDIRKNKGGKVFSAPTGHAAFAQCSFLQRARDSPSQLTEPQWYAALSIVSRFDDGRKQCHAISHKHPGYTVHDCNKKIDQSLSESSPRTCENVATLYDGCVQCPLFGKINSPVNLQERKFWCVSDKGTLIPQYNELRNHFEKLHPYKTIADMKTIYVFGGTHYEEHTPIEIKAFAEDQFDPKPKDRERQEFLHKVFANSIARRNFFLDSTLDRLNFNNGVLDINTKQLSLHSQLFGFRGVLPYDYDPKASCPTFDWWIKDVMCEDETLIKILQEYMGYVVRGGEYTFHKALWLSGSGRNGKSTFLSVLKALIGSGNYSTLSIKQITNDKFSSADLDGKIANFSEETSPEELSDSGPFKNLTGDGELLAQKKYGDPYSFRNRAKLIMTYNEVPELRDLSPGMLSRPLIVPWSKDLTAVGAQDRSIKTRLLQELPGIFNFALAGWERLEEQQEFTFSPKAQVEMDRIRAASCSALQWVQNYVTLLPINTTSSATQVRAHELYEAYSSIERYPYKAVKFFRRINELPYIKERRERTTDKKYYIALVINQKAHSEF